MAENFHTTAFASDHSILVRFGDEVSPEVRERVHRFCLRVGAVRPPEVLNIHPAYCSVLMDFDPRAIRAASFEHLVDSLIDESASINIPPPAMHEIPVRYGGIDGPDLADVASYHHSPEDEIVRRHTSIIYMVCFLGFSPGFPYLSGLPNELATPRLDTPRIRIPAGSVAIGGNQTGVYPVASAGGWRIIGRTEAKLFDALNTPPTLLTMGDRVKFIPVDSRP
ncbi:MAG TPA: 5-oxoprolinase subunit PxpB [Bacteroidota bacterium]|nr:5-oxoprolinase subunit PxpB [Bacteroidota bacterium]